jgi:hypothetical protein
MSAIMHVLQAQHTHMPTAAFSAEGAPLAATLTLPPTLALPPRLLTAPLTPVVENDSTVPTNVPFRTLAAEDSSASLAAATELLGALSAPWLAGPCSAAAAGEGGE